MNWGRGGQGLWTENVMSEGEGALRRKQCQIQIDVT